jgi:hypothetical protein
VKKRPWVNLLCLALPTAHAQPQDLVPDRSQLELACPEKQITTYPLVAARARAVEIVSGLPRVKVGMLLSEVRAILGEPDEVHNLYEPRIHSPKTIGCTRWYIVRRLVRSGSVNEKNEALVRVSFDSDGRVSHVDHWGIESHN